MALYRSFIAVHILNVLQAADYYQDAMQTGLGDGTVVPMFTACGPPRLKMGKYNAPVGLYSDETIMELGSGNHGFVE